MSPSPALRRPLALLTALATTAAAALVAAPAVQALAPDQPVLAGSLQDELGCAADWMPDCEATALVLDAATGKHTLTTDALPSGTYEVKVAVGGSWDENYGVGGAPGGANYTFSTQEGARVSFTYDPATHELAIDAGDSLVAGDGQMLGHLVDTDTIAWPADLVTDAEATRWELFTAPGGGISADGDEVTGGRSLGELTLRDGGLAEDELVGRAHLAGHLALDLPELERGVLEKALRGQLVVAQHGPDGLEVLTGLQIPGVLDALYADAAAEQQLGASWEDGAPSLALWAPTARAVTLQLHGPAESATDPSDPVRTYPMRRGADGTWTFEGRKHWAGQAYTFAVEVYVPALDQVVTNVVTDPYSVGLTVNSTHSVLVDLDDPRWAPEVWTDTPAPEVAQFADQTIYEMHLRDFSAGDEALPEGIRGSYAAVGHPDSAGSARLAELAEAGMTTVHLLPTFDIATIEEDRAAQLRPDIPADAGPASPAQQEAVAAVADKDAYNWGYDPLHYMAPEGSYATEGHQVGGERTREFRAMVGELHGMGLQVVLDQVYNHTAAHGQSERSVLDRIVPGYYQRLDLAGGVENSTCCSNIATEHAMAQKLMVDSTVTWARDYGVDGFRFDLMGHHSRENMLAVREALDELTLESDGVDGKGIYLYGEGWDFGEVAGNARFTQATQGQLGGTSIGTFNDRLRDAVHGGSPFDTDKRTSQGFGNGLATMPNGHSEVGEAEQLTDLRHRTDLIRLGMAGNLADYELLGSTGEVVRGDQLDYNGAPAGYATAPEETVNYVDAHDNEALYDMNVWKLPQDAPIDVRVRMNTLSLATVALGQSPSFWAGGTDLMRSKSLDRDSYDSGDHFNAIDWTEQDSGYANGLPPEGKNGEAWDLMVPMLEDPAKNPAPEDIASSSEVTLDLLRLRSSTPLFTLGDAELIRQKVTFPNAGPEATPGLLVMRIDDTVGPDVDPALDGVVTVFNASDEPLTEQIEHMAGLGYTLHEVQADGADEVVKGASWDAETGTVSVPAHTVAVFVAEQGTGEDGKRTGPPEHAGQKGRPAHAGEQGPPAHANGKAKGRAAGEG
ncbi:pullulanase-type alpha-1,6-glucosidase [Brachybacterium paraconglomeratum]|uniref:pullulanase-type alpha-1,6-glucosidase n=1 Tax=Brachybacterium paraconglomeratum TaxID=173362 RepID=UPI0021A6CBCC|nr:pullulanase-type alpha-1,6-glucosidase [Brachybacterium paraconglomeratum]MCT1908804.1 pullulanase-type alpha-1,6-glucosidase [Brachybacterium paraconglomeratum]